MSLWHRAPRAVYRVYDEDEYLAGDAAPGWDEPIPAAPVLAPAPVDPASDRVGAEGFYPDAFEARVPQAHDPRSRRVLGLALLGAVTTVVAALVAVHVAHRAGAPLGERAGASGKGERRAVAQTAPSAPARNETSSSPRGSASSGPAQRVRPPAKRSDSATDASDRLAHAVAHVHRQAIAAAETPPPSEQASQPASQPPSSAASQPPSNTASNPPSGPASQASSAPASPGGAEFGFEP